MNVPEKKIYTIDEIIKQVESISTPDPPNIRNYTSMDGYFESMSKALSIIKKYTDEKKEHSPETLQQDMIILSALHAEMAVMVGYLQGTSARAESAQKIAIAKYVIEISKTKAEIQRDGDIVKTTADEAKYGARLLAEDQSMMARDHETISRIITNTFYAIDQHVQVLRSALRRATSEQENTPS